VDVDIFEDTCSSSSEGDVQELEIACGESEAKTSVALAPAPIWDNQSAPAAQMLMFIFASNATNQRDLGSERLGNAWILEQLV
jgi:hypothetical protein